MTAQGLGIFTIDFPDPAAIDYVNNKFITLNDSISFQYRALDNVQTLSTKGVDAGADPYGILFVPDLRSSDCKRDEQQHVPANATRLTNLPPGNNYALIAFAPWFSPKCMLEYFEAARDTVTTKAFITYQPGDTNQKPPVLNDPSWNLSDGGSWQRDNFFPTYALSSMTGDVVMDQLNAYSGNLTTVPQGEQLATHFAKTDYVRLWATVNTSSGNSIPSLWVFLVIVLAILIAAIGVTSLCMHVIQRRRREALRQRVINGEIDLEALGVKRLTVPKETLDKLPIYTFTTHPDDAEKAGPQVPSPAANPPLPAVNSETGHTASPLVRRLSAPTASTSTAGAAPIWSQPTCPICIDDFEPNQTQVRELPCRHIFHPDCIDTFLLSNSSLCPMCKQSVLPPGAISVNVTNVMVRRERYISRMRLRGAHAESSHPVAVTPADSTRRLPGAFGSLGSRIGGAMGGRRVFSAPERTQPRTADMEMNATSTPGRTQPQAGTETGVEETATPAAQPNARDCIPTQNRREWARQRALNMLGTRNVPIHPEEEEHTGPRWRRALRKVFPGFS